MFLPESGDESDVWDVTSEEAWIAETTKSDPADSNPYAGCSPDLIQDSEFSGVDDDD